MRWYISKERFWQYAFGSLLLANWTSFPWRKRVHVLLYLFTYTHSKYTKALYRCYCPQQSLNFTTIKPNTFECLICIWISWIVVSGWLSEFLKRMWFCWIFIMCQSPVLGGVIYYWHSTIGGDCSLVTQSIVCYCGGVLLLGEKTITCHIGHIFHWFVSEFDKIHCTERTWRKLCQQC